MATVFESAVIAAPVDAVWARIRDFNGLPDWHPGVETSEIEDGRRAGEVGCVRRFRLRDGGLIRERLLALSDLERSCTYSILESPMGVEGYVATLRLLPITAGERTYAEWTARFACPSEHEAELVHAIGQGVFQGGFASLNEHFGRG